MRFSCESFISSEGMKNIGGVRGMRGMTAIVLLIC